MGVISSLNREQKQILGLLNIGTFLEYFDLMLYVHMAVLLNELFFPKTDPKTASLLSAMAFCSTFIFRPVGALIFGWMGDNYGRKSTIIATTGIMAVSCIIMATLSTYDEIGIAAAYIVTLCRIVQGMSSMGEIMGAQIYVAETIPRPKSFPAVAFISVASNLGGMSALCIAFLSSTYGINWRAAFWVGALIAVIGSVARSQLRETPDFLEMKREQFLRKSRQYELEDDELEEENKSPPLTWKQKVRFENLVAFFLVYWGWPLTFYLAYIYFVPLLKNSFGYTSSEIIMHNFYLSLILVFFSFFWAFLSYRIHPVK